MMDSFFRIPVAHAGVITDAPGIATGLTKVLNFLLSIVGIVGIIGLILSGLLYFFAAGDMRQMRLAKGALVASVTGILIALGAYVIVSQLSTFFS